MASFGRNKGGTADFYSRPFITKGQEYIFLSKRKNVYDKGRFSMEKMGLNEIREKFLSFYESKGHLRMPSFPLVPQGDSSLLLINSGMAPLKPYFTGQVTPPNKRATTCQKCIRTPDIERVGKTARHGTFFEMLGNFSFGDYFKKEATAWAWEFSTEVMKLPADRIYISYYEEDLETKQIWLDMGISEDHLVALGKEDNFWEIGSGPCGPCSELYFDRGEKYGCGSPDCAVGCECDRFIEFWNLVFTQFESDGKGNYTRLDHPNIDTGMGLERLACIMQDVGNLFEVDTIAATLEAAAKMAGVKYQESEKVDVSLRVITDHVRSTSFLISDGVLPSNEGRGYVLRRLLRRAARHGKLLGIDKPFLHELCDVVIEKSGDAYPLLKEKSTYIKRVIFEEEQRFAATIDGGLSILKEMIASAKAEGKQVLDGEDTFKLYDTFGFPVDLTKELLEEEGMTADEEGFQSSMNEQKKKAREARKKLGDTSWSDSVLDSLDKSMKTSFTGYDTLSSDAKIFAMVVDGEIVTGAQEGDDVTVILDTTSFYAESGGQIGDRGTITKGEDQIAVSDCKKTADGKYLHIGKVLSGSFMTGDAVKANVDENRRNAIMRNHSAAHLLQAALRKVLGDHIEQAGSYVDESRCRFDFSHFAALSAEEMSKVENLVNTAVLDSVVVDVREMPIDEAKKMGAMALFGEKYGATVRVVKMGDVSVEFCGGTHVENTGKIGLFKIVSESSVAAGVRRIEAVTGFGVMELIADQQKSIAGVAAALKSGMHDVAAKAEALSTNLRDAQKEIEALKAKLAAGKIDSLMSAAVEKSGILVLTGFYADFGAEELRTIAEAMKDKYANIAAVIAGSTNICAVCGKEAIAKGLNAGNLVRECAKMAGGGGGGRPDSAMAGYKDKSKIEAALAAAKESILAVL